ncbi:MAG: hypothetical protein MZU79_01265 [Anaerotruncus sp.]|nr:hypothetical protein [Anaerotruncus sp.]
MVTNDSLEALFLTGYVPGMLIIICMICIYCCVHLPQRHGDRAPAAAVPG